MSKKQNTYLLPYPVIEAAAGGDVDAINAVLALRRVHLYAVYKAVY